MAHTVTEIADLTAARFPLRRHLQFQVLNDAVALGGEFPPVGFDNGKFAGYALLYLSEFTTLGNERRIAALQGFILGEQPLIRVSQLCIFLKHLGIVAFNHGLFAFQCLFRQRKECRVLNSVTSPVAAIC